MERSFCVPNSTEGCGSGMCMDPGNTCQCFDGYVFDYTQMMFPNCYLTLVTKVALLSVLGGSALVSGIVAVFYVRYTSKIARKLCLAAAIAGFAQALHVLSLALEGRPSIATMTFFIIMNTFGGGVCPVLLLWTFISPVLQFLSVAHAKENLIRTLRLVVVQLSVAQMISYPIALYFLVNKNDFRKYNIVIAVTLLYVTVYTLAWSFALRKYSRVLLDHIDITIAAREQNKLDNTSLVQFRRKLVFVSWLVVQMTSAVSAVAFSVSLLYWILGVHPYRFIIYFIMAIPFPLNNLAMVFFAVRNQQSSYFMAITLPTRMEARRTIIELSNNYLFRTTARGGKTGGTTTEISDVGQSKHSKMVVTPPPVVVVVVEEEETLVDEFL